MSQLCHSACCAHFGYGFPPKRFDQITLAQWLGHWFARVWPYFACSLTTTSSVAFFCYAACSSYSIFCPTFFIFFGSLHPFSREPPRSGSFWPYFVYPFTTLPSSVLLVSCSTLRTGYCLSHPFSRANEVMQFLSCITLCSYNHLSLTISEGETTCDLWRVCVSLCPDTINWCHPEQSCRTQGSARKTSVFARCNERHLFHTRST